MKIQTLAIDAFLLFCLVAAKPITSTKSDKEEGGDFIAYASNQNRRLNSNYSNVRGSADNSMETKEKKASFNAVSLKENDHENGKRISKGRIPTSQNLRKAKVERFLEPEGTEDGEMVHYESEEDLMDDPPLFEGDIIPTYNQILADYGEEVVKALQEAGILPNDTHDENRHLGTVGQYRWTTRDNGVTKIPYSFSSSFSDQERSSIGAWLDDLATASGVLKFIPRVNESSYVNIVDGSSCSSSIGQRGGVQTLTLARGCRSRGVVQHEFLHALGFYHEQSRPDRDSFVTINFSNIQADKEHNFQKRFNIDSLESQYDYSSVMHYGKADFSRNGQNTIDAPQAIGQRNGASNADIIQVRLVYQCNTGPRSLSSYNANLCTNDCPCWENAQGCNGNSNACQGDLVCSNNVCTSGSRPTGGSLIELRSEEFPTKCFDLSSANTANGNVIHLWECNGTPAQHWLIDSEGYIRSALDLNKCVDPRGPSTELGTQIQIWDCVDNYQYQQWSYQSDGTIRPVLDNEKCIDIKNADFQGIHLWECNGSNDKKWRSVTVS
mmetsp:Transcript_6381/g.8519  ORF Transcript_6381/g.8519 Transcript_6381/m.8519 type:complete len:552 (-) Transcript_6381:364-2019(-)